MRLPTPPSSSSSTKSATATTTGKPVIPHGIHAISRSKELLSCARTALRLAQEEEESKRNQQNGSSGAYYTSISPQQLHLWSSSEESYQKSNKTTAEISIEESERLIRYADKTLTELESLVKRRGHVNDPTQPISRLMSEMETLGKDMISSSKAISTEGRCRGSSTQRSKHYDLVSQLVQGMAKHRLDRFQKAMELRGEVIKVQARRRRMLDHSKENGDAVNKETGGVSMKNKDYSQLKSPLFTATNNTSRSRASAPTKSQSFDANPTVTKPPAPPVSTPSYASYYGASASSYYNYPHPPSSDGIRRRTNAPPSQPVQSQTQIHKAESRLEEAHLAERKISDLTTVFHKMANLISIQGEYVEKIEDDVEAAHVEISAGEREIQKLYGITKGNRGLIIKVFAILIGLLIFFRLY